MSMQSNMQSKSLMRIYNKNKILDLIRKNQSIYRAELARSTGLSMPTIMSITDELVEDGLIRDVGKGISSGGKPPMLLEIIPDSHFFVGIDISGAMFKCIVLNLQGNIVHSRCQDKDSLPEAELIETIERFIEDTVKEAGVSPARVSGIGVGLPGLVDTSRGVVINSIDYNLHDVDLFTPLHEHFRTHVYIENSSKLMAIGEKYFGAGTNCEDFALVTVGRGIGAALIINSELYRGHYNMSGELGHMVINPSGPICKCGRQGCLETLASGKAIASQARNLVSTGSNSLMLSLAGGIVKKINCDIVFSAAAQGDVLAKRIADEAIDYLSIGLANLVSLFDCQRIVLTGYVVKNNTYLLDKVSDNINTTRSCYYGDVPVEVRLSELGEEAAVIGAAALPLQSFVMQPGVRFPIAMN